MQINSVNQKAEFNLPASNNPEKSENSVAVDKEKKSLEEAQDQIAVKNVKLIENAPVESNTSLKFSRDQQTNELVVELVNNQTGESLRQTPSKVSLKLSAIYAGLHGKLVDKNY